MSSASAGVAPASSIEELTNSLGWFTQGLKGVSVFSALDAEKRDLALSGVSLEANETPVGFAQMWGEAVGMVLTELGIRFDNTEWPDAVPFTSWEDFRTAEVKKIDYWYGEVGESERFRVLAVDAVEYPVVWGTYWRDIILVLNFFAARVPRR